MRNNTLTVADLIAILSSVDPTLKVKMTMNMEYENFVDREMVEISGDADNTYLYFTNTPESCFVDDTTYDANGNAIDLTDTI